MQQILGKDEWLDQDDPASIDAVRDADEEPGERW